MQIVPTGALACDREDCRRNRLALQKLDPRIVRPAHRIAPVDRRALLPVDTLRHALGTSETQPDIRDDAKLPFAELFAPRDVPVDLESHLPLAPLGCSRKLRVVLPAIEHPPQ